MDGHIRNNGRSQVIGRFLLQLLAGFLKYGLNFGYGDCVL